MDLSFSKSVSEICYNSIREVPVWNFFECAGDPSRKHLLKIDSFDYSFEVVEGSEILEEAYQKIRQERHETTLKPDKLRYYIRMMTRKRKYLLDYCKGIIEGDRRKAFHSKLQAFLIDEKISGRSQSNARKPKDIVQKSKNSLNQICGRLSKYMGYPVDPFRTSLYNYVIWLNLMVEDGKGSDKR